MKSSNSKSQLILTRAKVTPNQSVATPMLPSKRRKSQTQNLNRAKDNNKSKSQIHVKQEDTELGTIKNQQLFAIIETFYDTLCSLPMEMLMNSSDPQFWLNEQDETLKELQRKLRKLSRHKEYEYYHWKLESVSKLLSNITENMGMLQRITHLKGYYSGTDTSNYRSRGSSSLNSEPYEPKGAGLSNESDGTKEMISYDRYEIKPNTKPDKSYKTRSPQIMAETVYSDEQVSDDEPVPMMSSQVFQKKGFKRNASNVERAILNSQFQKQTQKDIELKDKTLAKIVPISKAAHSERTLSNYTIEDRFLKDQLKTGTQCETSQRLRCLNNDSHTIDNSKEQLTEQRESFAHQNQNQQFVVMIKQLRLDLLTKDKQIERLLINQQEYEEGIEIFQEREKQKNMEIVFMKQNVLNCSQEKEKLQAEIRRLHEYYEELKETVRYQRDMNKREGIQKDKLEEKYYDQANSKEVLYSEIDKLKEENKLCKKNQRIMKQKLEVYTKKYFKNYAELQQSRQSQKQLLDQVEDLSSKRGRQATRYDEIKEIVDYHKDKLCDQSF